jgi:hypothetical protein
MARTGRPKHKISKEEFEKLCGIQATEEECASWFDCDVVTLHRWVKMTYGMTFSKVFAQKKGKGKISLRRSLLQRACDPDGPPAIAIFVAKNHLGMSDKTEISQEVTGTQTFLVQSMTKEDAQKLLAERMKRVPKKP